MHFDFLLAGRAASGEAAASAQIERISRATRGLLLIRDTTGFATAFSHERAHKGLPLNQLADDLAKAGARLSWTTDVPFQLHPAWYDPVEPVAEWAWMANLSPCQKKKEP